MSSASDTEGGDVADGYSSDVARNDDYDTTEGSGVVSNEAPLHKGKAPTDPRAIEEETSNDGEKWLKRQRPMEKKRRRRPPQRLRDTPEFDPSTFDESHFLDVRQLTYTVHPEESEKHSSSEEEDSDEPPRKKQRPTYVDSGDESFEPIESDEESDEIEESDETEESDEIEYSDDTVSYSSD